jgi:L-alanine-DL-glutamate epimerase-like enolase superfamily enzyme
MAELTISEVDAWFCRVPLADPIDLGPILVRERDHLVVRMRTADGLIADCVTQVRGSPVDAVVANLLAPRLIGRSPADLAGIRHDVRKSLTAVEFDGTVGRAWSALEICLQDLRAQAVGWPLWRLLGGWSRSVPVEIVEGYSLTGESDEAFAERLAARAAEGYRLMKIEAGHYTDTEELLRRLERFRELSDRDVGLVLDFAWSWRSPKQPESFMRRLGALGVEWLEDTFHRSKVAHYRRLRDSTSIPVGCGDESSRPDDLRRLMAADALDVVRIDATTIGGFEAARELSAEAVAQGLRVSFHEHPEFHEHCVFGFESADHVEVFPTDRPFDCVHQLIQESAFDRIRDGHLSPPNTPGAGMRLREEAVARFAVRHARVTA